jgi:hypothetical protein
MLRVDPVTGTWLLITGLILLFSGTLFDDFWTKHERDCHARNAELLEQNRLGPLRQCPS